MWWGWHAHRRSVFGDDAGPAKLDVEREVAWANVTSCCISSYSLDSSVSSAMLRSSSRKHGSTVEGQ